MPRVGTWERVTCYQVKRCSPRLIFDCAEDAIALTSQAGQSHLELNTFVIPAKAGIQ